MPPIATAAVGHGMTWPSRSRRIAPSSPIGRTASGSSSARPTSGARDRDLRAHFAEGQVDLVLDALQLPAVLTDPRFAPQLPAARSRPAGVVDHDLELGVVDLFLLGHPRERVRTDQQRAGHADLVEG